MPRTDADKLRLIASWFDQEQSRRPDWANRTEVQQDLLRIADYLENQSVGNKDKNKLNIKLPHPDDVFSFSIWFYFLMIVIDGVFAYFVVPYIGIKAGDQTILRLTLLDGSLVLTGIFSLIFFANEHIQRCSIKTDRANRLKSLRKQQII